MNDSQKTADFVGLLLRLAFALAVVGGTTAIVGQYSQRAAWAIVLIILLGIFVYNSGAVSALTDFVYSINGGSGVSSGAASAVHHLQ